MAEVFGLYSHIQSNRRRSILLLIGLFVLVYGVGYAVTILLVIGTGRVPLYGDGVGENLRFIFEAAWQHFYYAIPFLTLGVAIWIVIGYYGHQKLIDVVTGSDGISRAVDPELYNMLETLCISRGMPMPKLKIIDSDALNAFASGMYEKQYAITVTRGLREKLTKRELEAVLAHELTHIRNGDVSMMVICVLIAGIASFLGEMAYRIFASPVRRTGHVPSSSGNSGGWLGSKRSSSSGSSGSSDSKGGGAMGAILIAIVIAVVIILVAWLLSGVLRLAISRSREYLADAGAVELTKDPDAMISALTKISGRAELEGVPSGIMEMCIENPRDGFIDLFATHPPIEDRISALVEHAGGKRPVEEHSSVLARLAEGA
jgi:heat shock protein HtpX